LGLLVGDFRYLAVYSLNQGFSLFVVRGQRAGLVEHRQREDDIPVFLATDTVASN
jgi:hypothetical protein